MSSSSNGSRKLLLWIATGLAVAVLALASGWAAHITSSIDQCRDELGKHGERIGRQEAMTESIREDLTEIKGDVKEIDRKIDRALRGK